MSRRGHLLAAAGWAALLTAAVVGSSATALAALPRPSEEERLVARALHVLADRREVATAVTTRRGSHRARCRMLSRTEELVTARGERRFRLVARRPETVSGRPLPDSVLRDAFLAGCPRPLATSVGRRLRAGRPTYAGVTTADGRRAHVLQAGPQGDVMLLVDAESLEPIAVRIGSSATALYVR